jgi:hypothetical protein
VSESTPASATPPKTSWGMRGIFVLVVVVFAAAAARTCGGSRSVAGAEHQISLDKQVWLGGLEGRATAIAKMPGGGFVIAGHLSTGWAIATDANGTILWKYEAPLDDKLTLPSPAFSHSEFHGVVPLANGNVLLCGEKYTNVHKVVALITILGRTGEVVEERQEFANGDDDYTSSSVNRCIQWNDGVALTGNTRDKASQNTSSWMMRLDSNGAKQWQEIFTSDAALFDPMATSDHNLLLSRFDSRNTETTLIKVNVKNEVVASSAPIKGDYLYLMRPIEPGSGIGIVDHYGLSNTNQLHTLGERLEQSEEPRQLKSFNLQEGFGFRRPDQSLVLFGSASTQSGDRGAVEWVAKNGDVLAGAIFPQTLESVTFGDAVALPNNQFLVVACQNAYASRTHGLFMSWITLK